jgi:spore maturation protein CgeB
MKILFISSGFLGVYPYLEESIIKAFQSLNHSILTIPPTYSDVSINKVKDFQPDVALSFVGYKTDERLLDSLKEKGIALCVWLTEDPYYIDRSVLLLDKYHYVFTIDKGAYEYYKNSNTTNNLYYLPLGTDTSLYYPEDSDQHVLFDICLVGYPYPNRIDLIQQILKHTSFTVLLVGPNWQRYFPKKIDQLKILPHWLKPDMVRKIYSHSKIILNPHRPFHFPKNQNSLSVESKSINNRTFDIAACQGFQLVENKPDLRHQFDLSQEIVAYNNNEEFLHLLDQYIHDSDFRNRYSQNARNRVLKSHTFVHRVKYIIEQVKRTKS